MPRLYFSIIYTKASSTVCGISGNGPYGIQNRKDLLTKYQGIGKVFCTGGWKEWIIIKSDVKI